ncbi:MAG: hypothetical protein HYR72_18220 [Deltaproteobacteria bacterium]|nr:hypothetical protein [Deltaproteobacteria bacterium]MBI3386343.1 hypothetical protein [Deltaproteobacteria bacterium]
MTTILAAGGGFLLAVLWMDLMFDVQVLRHKDATSELPETVLASIAAYYRRVTTDAWPMGGLIGIVMASVVLGTLARAVFGNQPRWIDIVSLVLSGGPTVLALSRVVPNAARLGTRLDSAAHQSTLARAICREHLVCLDSIATFIAIQLWAAQM